MRAVLGIVLAVVALLPGCVDEAAPSDQPLAAAEAPRDWTVISHLAPRGAMDVRFTVAEPTTCRMAFFTHQASTGGSVTDTPGHVDLWIDGTPGVSLASTSGFVAPYQERVAAGPVDSRDAMNAALDAYFEVVQGEGSSFYSGFGIREIEVLRGGRAVLSAMDLLVDNDQAVNLDVPGSLMASLECGAAVTLEVREDPWAVWTNPVDHGGHVAVHALLVGAESGRVEYAGGPGPTEVLVGEWGGVRGTLEFSGAADMDVVLEGAPLAEPVEHWFEAPPGALALDWTTARAYGNWWVGMASWQPHNATIVPIGTYPFG